VSQSRFLIIDGHSIIHAWDDLRKLHSRSASRYLAREELLKRMRTLQDMTDQRVIVVFDGTGTKVTDEREDGGVQVFYADSGHTADSVIERLAAKYAKQFAIRVCTADRMIWETVRAFEAHWISPDDLRFELERAEGDLRGRISKRK
jgi:predicted RNA-binding protein with PIN domain